MRSSFTAMAFAFGMVTVTALPAMAAGQSAPTQPTKKFSTEIDGPLGKGVGGDEVGTLTPDESVPGNSSIDKALLGESLDLGAGLPTLPTAPQGGVALRGGNVMQRLGDDDQRPAIQAVPPSIMPPSIKPTQGIQGQKVAPAASKGMIVGNKPGGNDVGMEVGDGGDPDDERSASKVVPSVTPALRKNPVGMAPPVEQEVRR